MGENRASGTAVARRSRDRQAEIAAAAAALFCRLGYHRVRIDDVAAAVGMRGPAIYRYFDGKEALLAGAVFDAISALENSVLQSPDLRSATAGLAALFVERRDIGLLLMRESQHGGDATRAEVDARLTALIQPLSALLRRDRAPLSVAESDLLVRSMLAAFGSLSFHSVVVPPQRAEALLRAIGRAVLTTSAVPNRSSGAPTRTPNSAVRSSRREALLNAAIELFSDRGYSAVRMEDVGAAAGITGPSIYQHFASKADLLVAALRRGAEWLQLGLTEALGGGQDAADAMQRVVRSYVAFSADHADIVGILVTEAIYLAEPDGHLLRRVQHDYVAEWVAVLRQLRPSLGDGDAHVLVHAVYSTVNEHVRDPRLKTIPGLVDVLVQLSLDVLLGAAA